MSPVAVGPRALQVGVTAVIPAAGTGSRMGGHTPKQFMLLAGTPVLARTLATFEAESRVDEIVVVVSEDQTEMAWEVIRGHNIQKVTRVVIGGAERQQSVARGLAAVTSRPRIVVIHDGARPLLHSQHLAGILDASARHPAMCMAVPVTDTIKQGQAVSGEILPVVVNTLSRVDLWSIQTPQVFHIEVLNRALAQAEADGFFGTDCASTVERLGIPVTIFPGVKENLKLTSPGDLALAEAILAQRVR